MNRNAEILCIGTEILMGDIVNTNAAFIAKELTGLGINVYHQSVVGDNPNRLKEALSLAFSRADIVITTGGLGPTYDDLTKETIAGYFHRELICDQPSLQRIQSYFASIDRPMTENNKKQAMMPKDAVILPNDNGTAPGCIIESEGKTAIMLPGPPREMSAMFLDSVVPYLRQKSDHSLFSHNLRFYGIGESQLEDILRPLMEKSLNPTVAPYAKTGEVMLRVTASAKTEVEAEEKMAPVIAQIKDQVGEYLYGTDVDSLQQAVVALLSKKGLKVATAESCTGGKVSEALTQIGGASGVFECGICAYSNRIKQELLGVKEETLQKYSAISAETAVEMAKGIRKVTGADIGVSVTGNAGPLPSEGKPVGLVYLAVESDAFSTVIETHYGRKDKDLRELIRYRSTLAALDLIRKAANAF